MAQPKILVFSSGTAEGGGFGVENLVTKSRKGGVLDAEIVGVVSNHENGGVRKRAKNLGIRFFHFPEPWDADGYREIAQESGADFFALSGWLKFVVGLDPRVTFNIHPGPLPMTAGMYGLDVHKAVFRAFRRGEITHSTICMHFVNEELDGGPIFFRHHTPIEEDDSTEFLNEIAKAREHHWQPKITNLVVHGKIAWDGRNPGSLIVPPRYRMDIYED
jgi:phosphoribosylglycinamide formyltransferase-1